jgi:hypothetical protein
MNDDYLWDRSGDPDRDVEDLEHLLRVLRHRPVPLDLDRSVTGARPGRPVRRMRPWVPLAMAAALVVAAGASLVWFERARSAWTVEPVRGVTSVASERLNDSTRLHADQWLETGAASSARLMDPNVGLVEIGPATRVRLVRTAAGQHRFALSRGSLLVHVWAPPGEFYVETPAATAVDLGCVYSLDVDAGGTARLHVLIGWVGVRNRGVESLVPAGATCITMRGHAPGTPRFDDVSTTFADALSALDAGDVSARHAALDALLPEARPRDAVTLWHLLSRLDRASAERVYDRLAAVSPPPPQVRRDRILAGDREALDAWWDSFGVGSASLFRMFREGPAAR